MWCNADVVNAATSRFIGEFFEADRKVAIRLNGRGNAISPGFRHTIDRTAGESTGQSHPKFAGGGVKKVSALILDDPEGMWLAETASRLCHSGGA